METYNFNSSLLFYFVFITAMQRREVVCQAANGSTLDVRFCNEIEKPTQRQECYNDKCKGTWKVGEWSEVSKFIINIIMSFLCFFNFNFVCYNLRFLSLLSINILVYVVFFIILVLKCLLPFYDASY